jgi:hypothetical protein
MSTELELPDRLYVISKVYFSENACEIWATTFRDFYVPAIPWPGPSRPMSLRCVFARTLDSARARTHAISRLLPEFRACIREINFVCSLFHGERNSSCL